MNARERKALEQLAARLRAAARVLFDDINAAADEIMRHVMKKTTQRSPEFHGRACR